MKKLYIFAAVLALLTLSLNAQTRAGHAPMRAVETVTFTAGTDQGNNNTSNWGTPGTDEVSKSAVTITCSSAALLANPYRIYQGTMTISTTEGTITDIVINGTATNYPVTRLSTTTGTYTTNNNVGTWTGDNASITFDVSGQVRVSSIEVTYETDDNIETATLDIFSDTQDANTCLPVYGGYHDHSQHNQMVYPASMLTDMVGQKIKSMTFYPASVTDNDGTYSGIGFRNGSVTFKLMEVNNSTGFDSNNPSFITGSMTTVKTVNMPSTANTSATTWLISFDQPYEYNGGDLVIDVTNTTGDYRRTYFYTGNTSSLGVAYPGYYTYSGSTGNASVAVNYIPKVTFTYENTLPRTDAPVITADTTATAVTITATATDPTATVTMTINGQTYTGTGTATATFPRGNTDSSVNVSATAQEAGLAVSVPATATIGIPALPKTDTPTISVVTNADGSKTVSATGNGTVHLYVDGAEVTNPYTIMPSTDGDHTYTVTATAQEEGKQISDTATETVTIAEVGRSPMPTITVTDNGDGTYTITATGTGTVSLYINDAEHGGTAGNPILTGEGSVSMTVEEHSQAMVIPLQATNQEGDLLVSHTAELNYTIPAMTIDNSFQTLDPQPANASTPINLSKVMFVDRFRKVIPFENNHPRLYDYYLQETQVRQRTSNSVEVPVKHTGSDGLGFYSLNQIDNDTVRTLKMDVRNAAMEMALESDPGIYYYYGSRSTVASPDVADKKYLGVLQHTTDDYYTETLNPSYDYQQSYPGGTPHIHLDTDTIQGEYNDYLMYVPQVMTMGFDRVLYESDHRHNTYGAPKWKTGVGDVTLSEVDVEQQINSASTTWNDNGQTSIYMMTLKATGTMPTVNTIPYEPYMFRVFVESRNGKLRNWKWVPEDTVNHVGSHFEAAPGTTTGPICVWSEYVKDSLNVTFNEAQNEVNFVKTKVDERDPETGAWTVPGTMNILFAALNDMQTTVDTYNNEFIIPEDLTIYVRFYYIVKGSADGHIPVVHGQRPRGSADDPAGYGTESPGNPPSPSTGVKEVQYVGEIVSQTFYNVQGMSSDKPFDGINIVVTRYSDGTTRTAKVVR